ncbi:MAG TPA: SDR family NAD(P)-dependent oxidoreductase [Stellaceae bacterium]|nr:SDR family NAD(P)-dependent oxidoreductase [Stellaceae bacterium]
MEFRDRHVVVTGGTGALGLAVVQALVQEGATAHVSYVLPAEAERFPLREHASVRIAGPVELTREADVDRFYAGIPKLWGSIHLAGGFAMGGIVDAPLSVLMQQIDMNLVTAYLCCRAAVRAMQQSGGGRIVNVAARPALEGRAGAGMVAYAASKAGVATLTMALAEEVAKDGILVNAIAPSILDTPANRKSMPTADYAAWPKVEEVARVILSLASPENHVARGGVVPVYGRV